MSFGRRRFDRVVVRADGTAARFLPCDLAAPAEYATERELRRAIFDNIRQPTPPLPAEEEALALKALECFARNRQNTHPTRTALARQHREQRGD